MSDEPLKKIRDHAMMVATGNDVELIPDAVELVDLIDEISGDPGDR